VARFEQKSPEFLCFIKGEATRLVRRPLRPVSGGARVTHEVDVLIRGARSELRRDLR
jgi:hypothetical protein